MKFSKLQTAIFDWVSAQSTKPTPGSLVIEAVAGSGKTTTIVEAAKLIPTGHRAIFLAFNKSIALELGKRLPSNVEAKTLNAIGHRIVASSGGRVNLDVDKTKRLINNLSPSGIHLPRNHYSEIHNLVSKAKAHGLVPESFQGVTGLGKATFEAWLELLNKYQVSTDLDLDRLFNWCTEVLWEGLRETNTIDFDDQMYHVVAYNLPALQYDWVVLDEAQDVSPVQLALVSHILKSGGTLIAVGDPRQAIYGFRGADSKSISNIIDMFDADTLPLSITYRCPKSVVKLAQTIVPGIEAFEGAAEGEVNYPKELAPEDFTGSDLILCRNTAPLISLAYRMAARRLPCRVIGKDIGAGLVSMIKKVAGRTCRTVTDFDARLERWFSREFEKAVERGNEALQAALSDKVDTLRVIIQSTEATTVVDLIIDIQELFAPGTAGPKLATVHKAKGMEAKRVIILEPDLMPSPYANSAWELEQEENLMYVAWTRALETLEFIDLDAIQ